MLNNNYIYILVSEYYFIILTLVPSMNNDIPLIYSPVNVKRIKTKSDFIKAVQKDAGEN